MPIANYNLPEAGGNVYRMVVEKICRDLAERLELSDETIFFIRGDDEENRKQPGAALGDLMGRAGFTTPTKMTVTAERFFPAESRLTNRMVKVGTPTVFLDDDTNLFIKPVYRYCVTNLNITLRFKNRSEGRAWLRTAERRLNARITDEYHELEYSYPLPLTALRLICEVYDRKHSWLDPKPETFQEYINRCMTPRATQVVNQAANNGTVVIKERMTRVIGSPTFIEGDLNNPDADKSNGTYSMTLQYRFEYDAVDGVTVGFPFIVHNQLMPGDIISPFIKERPNPWKRHEQRSTTQYFLDTAGKKEEPWSLPGASRLRAMQPHWDDFTPRYINPNQNIILSTLVLLDPASPTPLNILKLDELGEWDIDPDALDYMRENYMHLNKVGHDVFHVNVYDGPDPDFKNGIDVGPDLMVSFKETPDYTKTYRLVTNLHFDLGVLSPEALERLRQHYNLAVKILTLLYTGNQSLMLRQLPDGTTHRGDFNAVVGIIAKQRYKKPITGAGVWPLVNLANLQANRSDQL